MTKYSLIFTLGALLYGMIELLWRGWTHWSMLLTGGFCFCMIYYIDAHLNASLAIKAGIAAFLITFAEFIVGLFVNRMFHMGVWDYSGMRFNLLGQICPLFSLFWFFLAFPAFGLCRLLNLGLFSRMHL